VVGQLPHGVAQPGRASTTWIQASRLHTRSTRRNLVDSSVLLTDDGGGRLQVEAAFYNCTAPASMDGIGDAHALGKLISPRFDCGLWSQRGSHPLNANRASR